MNIRLCYLKELIERRLECKVITHRAGRWTISDEYTKNLGKAGRIAYFMNKDNINKIAVKYGLDVLDNYVVNKGKKLIK